MILGQSVWTLGHQSVLLKCKKKEKKKTEREGIYLVALRANKFNWRQNKSSDFSFPTALYQKPMLLF